MKKNTLVVLGLLVGICLLTVPAAAQFSMKIGPVTGMNFNIHTGSDVKSTGTGAGFVIGGEADMMFNPTIGMLARLLFYDNMSGSTSSTENLYDIYGNPVAVTTDQSASVAYFTIDALFKLKLRESNLYFVGGPSFGINMEGSYENTQSAPGYQSQTSKGSLQDMQARFGLKVGAGYDIAMSPGLTITPQASFMYGLTKVQSNVSWRILSIFVGGSVKFSVL